MTLDDIRALDPISRLSYWIEERERIRLLKDAGFPPPWTQDEILRAYRFTNVRRWDDRVSQWLWSNWYQPHLGHPNMVYAIGIARFFNQPDCLQEITRVVFGDNWDAKEIKRRVRKRRQKGLPIWNAAYLVRGNDGKSKIESVVDYNIGAMIKAEVHKRIDPTSMFNTWSEIVRVHGFGSFMAGQLTADARWAIEGTWEDRLSWAPLGPGSLKGMNLILGREVRRPITQREFGEKLLWLASTLIDRLPTSISSRLECFDYQNTLCEQSKYHKALFGLGRPKQGYPGTGL